MVAPTSVQLSPLHTHTQYSVLDGASSIDQYLEWCKQNGAPALGVTDHGWMIGALELYKKAKKAGITPLPGCEFYVAPEENYAFGKKPYDYYHVTVWAVTEAGYRNLLKLGSLAWKQDQLPGWKLNKKTGEWSRSLVDRVVSRFGNDKPRITFTELLEHNEGLILGSGCLIGSINKSLLQGEMDGAEKNLFRLLEVYKGRFFLELMPHICNHDYDRKTKGFVQNECTDFSPDGDLQRACNLKNIELSRKHDLPLLLTIDSHFVAPEQKKLQDVLLQNGDPDGWRFFNSYHMMTTDQAWEHWTERYGEDIEQQKIFCEAVENNQLLADAAQGLTISDPYRQPVPEIPAEIRSVAQDTGEAHKLILIEKIKEHGRMKDDPAWEERLARELDVICDNGIIDFSPYFIFLEKWYRWTKQRSILAAPGRGSGAGSLLCYLLGITHLDPFAYGLPFERFLSHARLKRGKFPDIDCDFGDREPLLRALEAEYGEKFAQCSTHQSLKVKSALKDACRVILGWNSNDPRIDALTKTVENTPQGVADRDFLLGYQDLDGQIHDGHLAKNEVLGEFFRHNKPVYEMVIQLLGIPRAVGRHASAYFISDRPIHDSVPTCNLGGHVCTQYVASSTNNMAEAAGLIKFDFLRVNTLSDISKSIRLIQARQGYDIWTETEKIGEETFEFVQGELPITALPITRKGDPEPLIYDVYDLPEVDEVFTDFDNGKTESIFQVNSPLMTGFARRIKPRSIKEMSDIVALVRPGPLEACVEDGKTTMTEAYIARKAGKMPVTFAHPGMEPILKDTFGVAVYQEQLQQMFQDLAGYSPEEADYLRETLAKKKKQEMEKAIPQLRTRLAERQWTEQQAEVFVGLCISSSAYSFNRSHSASYGVVAYQCAFLKHFFPLEWWTAVLCNAKVDDIKEKGYGRAVRDILLMPHVNGPTDTFNLDDHNIHAPLYLIDGVGDAACKSIANGRMVRGEYNGMSCQVLEDYKSFQDFFERIDKRAVNQAVMHQLIICGAFKLIEPTKTTKQLIEEYHYLKKVSTLKSGEGKTSNALVAAVEQYKIKETAKGTRLEIPELYMDDIELEILRIKSLPLYRMDVHEHFHQYLQNVFLYSGERATYRTSTNDSVPVLMSAKEIGDFWKVNRFDKNSKAAFCGLLSDSKEFRYNDARSGKQVTALKLQITNDGDTVEVVLWPDTYAVLGKPKMNRIVLAVGGVRQSRDPGKWSISAQGLKYL